MDVQRGEPRTRQFTQLCDRIEARGGVPWNLLGQSLAGTCAELVRSWRVRTSLVALVVVCGIGLVVGVPAVPLTIIGATVTGCVVLVGAVVLFNAVELRKDRR